MTSNSYKKHVEKYGCEIYQEGDLYIPDENNIGVICFFHGGFWRMPYDREQLTLLSVEFAKKGFAVWNIEYRRIGANRGGWHDTFDDVITSINYLKNLAEKFKLFDLSKLMLAGHSAGGHLAIWAAKQIRTKPLAVIGLAPIIDIEKAYSYGVSNHAVSALLGGSPGEHPDRYVLYSPIRILPLGVRQLIIHGDRDEYLPVEWTRSYLAAASAAGDDIDYIEIDGGTHMDFLNPTSAAASKLKDWIIKAVKTYPAK